MLEGPEVLSAIAIFRLVSTVTATLTRGRSGMGVLTRCIARLWLNCVVIRSRVSMNRSDVDVLSAILLLAIWLALRMAIGRRLLGVDA